MSKDKELIDVIDEMLEKLDDINEAPEDFGNELNRKLNNVASNKGYNDYNTMLSAQSNNVLNFVKKAIDEIAYDVKHEGLYKIGHQEALNKYYEIAKNSDIKEVVNECHAERKSISTISIIKDEKLRGYRDGLYIFTIIVEDALKQGN